MIPATDPGIVKLAANLSTFINLIPYFLTSDVNKQAYVHSHKQDKIGLKFVLLQV